MRRRCFFSGFSILFVAVPCCLICGAYYSVNARVFYHDQSFPAKSCLSAIPEETNGFRVERVSVMPADTEVLKGGSAVEVILPDRLSPLKADTIDGVVFTISANKTYLKPGDTLMVRYRIRNRTMGTVVYDFNSACQFDLQVTGKRGSRLYSFLEKQICSSRPSRITLRPSTETIMEFPPCPLAMKSGDTLRVTAQMAGYPLSAVELRALYAATSRAAEPVALEGPKTGRPVIEFNHDTRMLVIRLDRAQRLTISAFVLTGKKVNKLSCERFLAPGTHLISFNNRKLADGVVIFKVEGAGISESKTINLTR